LFWRWVGRAVRPYAGWIIAGLGLIFILAGYLGVSREALVAKQLPYLISGGIGGVALIGLGAVFLGTEELRRDSGRLDRLEEMVSELHGLLLELADEHDLPAVTAVSGGSTRTMKASAAANGSAVTANGAAGRSPKRTLVALPVGHSFHRPDCTMVSGKPNVEVVTDRHVDERGLRPCRLCEPDQSDLLPW
jgi:hypothetical protein